MLKICRCSLLFSAAFFFLSHLNSADAQKPNEERRFVGLHFDFHAKETDTGIGRTFSKENADAFLKQVKPDYIQIDCKGHPGYASYPTKMGNAVPKISKDLMRSWRDITRENGVELYAHYSGLMDGAALKKHPDWAVTKPDNTKTDVVSVESNYYDELMIPQLKELALEYKIDGVWIDGDCWAARVDYSPAMISKYRNAFPGQDIPQKPGDKNYNQWISINRSEYKKDFSHYVDALHAVRPDFKMINNWAFSEYMPEKVDVNVDFLSGDIRGNSPYEAAFEGRSFAAKGKPWDIMTWAIFYPNNKKAIKSYDHIIQEASNILALGGGFSTYWQQYPDGNLPYKYNSLMADIIKFCRQREDYCFRGDIVPQVGLLLTNEIWKKQLSGDHLYSEVGSDRAKEMFSMLQEAGYSTDFIAAYDMDKKLASYPVVILPGWGLLDNATLNKLNNYVTNGGNLLVAGANTVRQFAGLCKIPMAGNLRKDQQVKLTLNASAALNTDVSMPQRNNGKGIGNITDGSGNVFPAATVSKVGKGNVCLVYFDPKSYYSKGHIAVIQNVIEQGLEQLFPNPVATLQGAPMVQQVVTRKNGHLFVHLINMSGEQSSYETVPPVQSFKLIVNTNKRPSSVLLQPENNSLHFAYKDNKVTIDIPGFQFYSIVQID
ncbi:MAG TPA: alpha-amylase family protein [Parafilimonas sp.]|nr:alpha-amylase family protein [Parafilimonas sp.]